MKGITILGSTGSIGMSTLDVIVRHPDKYRIKALTANTNVELLLQQCINHSPEYAVMANEDCAEKLEQALCEQEPDTRVLSGMNGLLQVVGLDDVDCVMAGIVGAAGLFPALAAARAGKRILLANKEALVMSGKLFMDTVRENGAELLPVDSEHNAILQSMPFDYETGLYQIGISKILLTASGGPFRNTSLDQLADVTPDQACAHPNWSMGRKISVDSATMMNKGLELIEACWLFAVEPDCIEVVIHPESVIHSMVEYVDGSVLAQLGNPDMRTPIACSLAWPERIESGVQPLNLFEVAQLNFEQADECRFPCLRLAREAMQQGGTSSAILNAANEVAVSEFLQQKIRFTDIPVVIETVLENVMQDQADSVDAILDADQLARDHAIDTIRSITA